MRSTRAWAAKPPKMTEWTAPMRRRRAARLPTRGTCPCNGDSIALAYTKLHQKHSGHLLHFFVEFGVCDLADFAGLAFP